MIPLSKTKAKYIKSLQLKKNRDKEKRFLVEGKKTVLEFLNSAYELILIAASEEFYDENDLSLGSAEQFIVKISELGHISTLKTNNAAIAVFAKLPMPPLPTNYPGLILALDGISDPGNFGTIIRTADWFNIQALIVNDESVDPYNPKVIRATKGSFCRVKIYAQPLAEFLKDYPGEVLAAEMSGRNLADIEPIDSGVIIMGNESHGISSAVAKFVTKQLTIPVLGGAESLNVGVATGIVCYMLTRPI